MDVLLIRMDVFLMLLNVIFSLGLHTLYNQFRSSNYCSSKNKTVE